MPKAASRCWARDEPTPGVGPGRAGPTSRERQAVRSGGEIPGVSALAAGPRSQVAGLRSRVRARAELHVDRHRWPRLHDPGGASGPAPVDRRRRPGLARPPGRTVRAHVPVMMAQDAQTGAAAGRLGFEKAGHFIKGSNKNDPLESMTATQCAVRSEPREPGG